MDLNVKTWVMRSAGRGPQADLATDVDTRYLAHKSTARYIAEKFAEARAQKSRVTKESPMSMRGSIEFPIVKGRTIPPGGGRIPPGRTVPPGAALDADERKRKAVAAGRRAYARAMDDADEQDDDNVADDNRETRKRRKGENPPGTIYGDPVISPTLDEDEDTDEDERKALAAGRRAYAKAMEEDAENEEGADAKAKRAAAAMYARLKDMDSDDGSAADDDQDDDDVADDDDAKRLRARKDDSDEDDDSSDNDEARDADADEARDSDDDSDSDTDDAKRKARNADMYGREFGAVRGRKGMRKVRKISFADIIVPRGVRAYPLYHQTQTTPRVADDDGLDTLNRQYADGVLERLGGGLRDYSASEDSPIPVAGYGPTLRPGDTRGISYKPQRPRRFMRENEGDLHHTAGEDRGFSRVGPNRGNGEPYELLVEGAQPGTGPVRIGNGWLLNPQSSGISGPSQYRSARSATTQVLKSRRTGLFRSVLDAPLHGFSDTR